MQNRETPDIRVMVAGPGGVEVRAAYKGEIKALHMAYTALAEAAGNLPAFAGWTANGDIFGLDVRHITRNWS